MQQDTLSGAAHAAQSGSLNQIIAHVKTPLYRNAYALTASSASTSLLGILYWVLAARYYKTESVGLNSAAIAATLLLSSIAVLYLDGAFIRFIPRAGEATGRFILYAYLTTTTAAAVVSLVFLLGVGIWAPALNFLNATPWSIAWFLVATMTSCIFLMEDGALTGLRQTIWVPIENTTFAVAKIILLLLFAKVLPEYGIFASWTLPAAVLVLPVNWLIFRRLLRQHQHATQAITRPIIGSQVFQYVAGNYIGFLFLLCYTKLLPLMVINLAGSNASAYFYLPWVIVTSLQLVATNMSASLVVEGTVDQTHLHAYVRRAVIHTARLLIPVVLILFVASPLILSAFGKEYAAEGANLLRLLLVALIPNILCVLFIGLSRVQRRIDQIVAVQAALAVLVLSLSYALLPGYGITGVGWAWLISQSLAAAVLFFTKLRPILLPAHALA